MIIDFYNKNGGSPSPTGDATELQPKTAVPTSGAAGTVIALNKGDEYGWITYFPSPYNAEKSRIPYAYIAYPNDNPNPDFSQLPMRVVLQIEYPYQINSDGRYDWNSSYEQVECQIDYQNNLTVTNAGNFVLDGDKYVYTASIYDEQTGDNINKTIVSISIILIYKLFGSNV